jgi:hypothetical protein
LIHVNQKLKFLRSVQFLRYSATCRCPSCSSLATAVHPWTPLASHQPLSRKTARSHPRPLCPPRLSICSTTHHYSG